MMYIEFEHLTKLHVVCDPEKGDPKEGTRDHLNIVSVRIGGLQVDVDRIDSDEKRAELDKIESACWEQIRFLQEEQKK